MADIVDRATRSRMMGAIGGKNTEPERKVRSYLHGRGLRFRLHRAGLPGRPDLLLPRHNVAVLVHGCFWHRHANCRFAYTPKSNRSFWNRKFRENVERDHRNVLRLRKLGWRVFVVWECSLTDSRLEALTKRIRREEFPVAKSRKRRSAARRTR